MPARLLTKRIGVAAMSVEDWEAKMVDSCNRSLRTALHKNVVEQSNCDSATRTLDAQKRWVHSRLTKEEREVRQQLQLLQLEQKHLSEQPVSSETDTVTDPAAVGMESGFPDPDEVINPYPITSRLKHNSSGTGNHNDSGTGVSGGGGVGLRTPRNVTADQQQELMGGGGRMWVGDLEAISSIRRGLKPPCRQRIDQQQIWARSKSLKERPQSSALNRCFAMSRSRSLRNPSGKAQPSPTSSELGSPRGSVPCSRSGSLKGGMSSSPRKSEPCPVIDPFILRRSLSLKAKISSSSSACSRDQSGVNLESSAIDAPPSMMDLGIHSFSPRPRLSTPNLAVISDLVPLPPITVSTDALPSCPAVSFYAPNGSNDSPECQSRSRQTAKVTLALRTSLSPSGKCDAARVGSAGGAGRRD